MTGSLQIKNGKYYAVINTTGINGKRKLKWVSTGLEVKGNKKRAEQFLRDTIKEYELKANQIHTDILFCDYVRHWLEVSKMKVDIITHQGYSSIANIHIIPYFEKLNLPLTEVTRDIIQQYLNSKFENGRYDGKGGLSPRSVKLHKTVIQLVLKEAHKSNLILNNPCEYVILPKQQKRKPTFYTASQLQELFSKIKDEELYNLIYFTVVFGLRRSEVLGLKWDSVNFETNTITIKHTVVQVSEIVEKDGTKNASSFRSYPLTDETKQILLQIKSKENENRRLFGKEYTENDYIFKWDDGKQYKPDYVSHKFSKLLEQNDLPHIRFHDLRHSCASLLIAKGFTLKDIQEWLGHSDIKVTANIYAHLDATRKNNIANAMSSPFSI